MDLLYLVSSCLRNLFFKVGAFLLSSNLRLTKLFFFIILWWLTMARLTEKERIEILIIVGYGDKIRSHEEACALFNKTHFERVPICRTTVSRSGRPPISSDAKLNVLLVLEENPHASTTQVAL